MATSDSDILAMNITPEEKRVLLALRAAGGGSGALPTPVVPNSFLVPSGVETYAWGKQLTVRDQLVDGSDTQARSQLSLYINDPDFNIEAGVQAYSLTEDAVATSAEMRLYAISARGTADFTVTSTAPEFGVPSVNMTIGEGSKFSMTNFATGASDAAATMTVNGVVYGIAKAIPVILDDGQTYFFPLFGPAA